VKAHLLEVAGELLSFEDTPEALEYRQSQNLANEESAGQDSELSAAAQGGIAP
jgi:hypothetical protein